jgi:hypothetical protein
MSHRILLGTTVALLLACGDAEGDRSVDAAPPALPLTGTYQVTGTTVDKATGAERGLTGTIIVKAEGNSYTSTFSLNTTLHGLGEPQKAELIGHGEGTVEGRVLSGTAETQMIVALVPGVDAGFGMMPRVATARILNRSEASIDPEGRVQIEIESSPAPGSEYTPSRTTLRGRRVADVGLGGITRP